MRDHSIPEPVKVEFGDILSPKNREAARADMQGQRVWIELDLLLVEESAKLGGIARRPEDCIAQHAAIKLVGKTALLTSLLCRTLEPHNHHQNTNKQTKQNKTK